MKNKELSEQLREMTEYSESPKINRLIEKHVAIEDFDYFEDSKFRKYIQELKSIEIDSDDDESVMEMKVIAEKLHKNGMLYNKIIAHMNQCLVDDPEVVRMERDVVRERFMTPRDKAKHYYLKRQESNGWWLYLMMHRNNRRQEEISV